MTGVDVVIPVHSVTRPIRRAVESVLAASDANARAVVVAHGLPGEDIAALLDGLLGPRVIVEALDDGIRSPAGPFNHGLRVATAEFVCVMGSDDVLEPRALDAALRRAGEDAVDVVILPLRHADGTPVPAPLPRPWRARMLDPVRDRLFTRTAPLAIIRRSLVLQRGLSFDGEFASGDDIEFGARLWMDARVSYHRSDPAYVIGADAVDRVTTSGAADLATGLAAARSIARRSWVAEAAPSVRRSLAIKMLRVHLLGAVAHRVEQAEPLDAAESALVAETARAWCAVAPGVLAPFSRADRAVIMAALEGADDDALRRSSTARASAGPAARLIPKNPLRVVDRESTLRRYLRYAIGRENRRR